jgi:hypothetical protein
MGTSTMSEEKKEYPIYSDDPASGDFISCFPGGGGPNVECTCGRTHFAIDSDVLEPGEEVYYVESNKEDPDGFIITHGVDCIHYASINGWVFVDDCPCNGMRRYERLFWNNRKEIRQYLCMVKMRLLAESDDVGEWQEDIK